MKRVLLIISGGIAAYKSLELIRLLQKAGVAVTPVLTRAAEQFVTPLSVAALAGQKAYTDLFDLKDEAEMGHIALSRAADLVLVAPATANILGQMANGLAQDLATTLLMATDKPVMVAPSMNVRMWEHKAMQRNLATLQDDGILFVGPVEGDMACGEFGPGRMSEPFEIVAAVEAFFKGAEHLPLKGKKAIVTSGPTHEPIDPVRYIANRSSGKQGHAIAQALVNAGAEVTLVSGPCTIPAPQGVTLVKVESAKDMLKAVEAALPADIAVFAAAVADWAVEPSANKLKKQDGKLPSLSFAENPDIAATIGKGARRPALAIGFAAETQDLLKNGETKRLKKGMDWIVANDVSPENGIFGGEENQVHLLTQSGAEAWPRLGKDAVAEKLVARIAAHFAAGSAL